MLRPLIPNALMAWLRIARQSRSMRSNVDVWVGTSIEKLRWLIFTPDTYRIGRATQRQAAPSDWTTLGSDATAPPAAWDSMMPVVVAQSTRPAMPSSRRIIEPAFSPTSVSFPPGTELPESNDLAEIVRRFGAEGVRYQAVVELPYTERGALPSRPVNGDAVIVVSAVPLHDVGGGSRGAQLAQTFLKQGLAVAYISAFVAQESDDLGIRYKHDLLEQWTLSDFDVAQYASRVAGQFVALISVPSSDATDLARAVHKAGGRVIYDLIDDWDDPGLGSDWFDPDAEQYLMDHADNVIASATDLVQRVRKRAHREATLVPNGVNEDVFGQSDLTVPPDWPSAASLIIGYHGSLYGSWLDWEAVTHVAHAYPHALVVMIGDPKGVPSGLPRNVRLLGLKPQAELPAYVQRFDIGLLPFLTNSTTHAVSPLKVYEYLASGVPVAAPPLRALSGLAGVHMAADLVEAVRMAEQAAAPSPTGALAAHGWTGRVDTIIRLAGLTSDQGQPVTTLTEVAEHFGRRDRLL